MHNAAPMQSTPSPAATAAAAAKVAALAVVVAKKRVAKLNGQLRNEAEKWEWWKNDRRTKIRISKWAESNNDLEDRVKELEEDLKQEEEMSSGLATALEKVTALCENVTTEARVEQAKLDASLVLLEEKIKKSAVEVEKLAQQQKELLAYNDKLRKADCFKLVVQNDFYRAQNREQREHILMREEDTDAPAGEGSGGGSGGHKRRKMSST